MHRLGYLLLTLLLANSVWAADQPKTIEVQVAMVARETVYDEVEALGTLKANEVVDVAVSVPEIISEVRFTDGQHVKRGDVLVQMRDAEEQALLAEAHHTLEESKSQLARIKSLAQRGDASQSLLDERQREYNVSQAKLSAIESRLQDRTIVAPFNGRVGLRNVSVGAYLAAGDVVTTLVDDSVMKLDFAVPSVLLNVMHTGMPIRATSRAFDGQVFEGSVMTIDNRIDPVSRSLLVRALLPNKDGRLKPGLLMEVRLLSNERSSQLIPEEALVSQGKYHRVFIVNQKQQPPIAEPRPVEIGQRWYGRVEIIKGLQDTDVVITHGNTKVKPGQPVTIQNADNH